MISSYEAGYYTTRWCTKMVKVSLFSKLVKKTYSKAERVAIFRVVRSKLLWPELNWQNRGLY